MSETCDAVVVGGGLAGAAFAVEMAAAGRDVALIERESGPHDKVCGEFLSGEAVGYLARLGIDLGALGATPIDTVRLSQRATAASRALPFAAMSLSRRVLDEALLERARAAGVSVMRGAAVRELGGGPGGWIARLDDGRTVAAREAVLATGKHDLRGRGRPDGRQNDLIGLKCHFRPKVREAAGSARTVDLGLFPGGYAGLEAIEDGLLNLCLLVRSSRFAAGGRTWPAALAAVRAAAPLIAERLDGAAMVHGRPLAIARIPYGLVVAQARDGLWRLGDQAAVIPSFAGEGMSMALHSARLAAAAMLAGEPADAFQARFACDVRAQVRLATRLSRALVHAPAQVVAARTARLFPGVLGRIATATRLPPEALAAA